MDAFIVAVRGVLKEEQILLQEPMRKHTTFQIGGPADCLLFPATLEEIVAVFSLIHKYEVPFTVLGDRKSVV